MLSVKRCCFCLELNVGGITIGALQAIGTLAKVILISIALSKNWKYIDNGYLALVFVEMATYILAIISAVCLLVGSIKYNSKLIKTWLIYTVFFCILSTLSELSINAQVLYKIIIQLAIQLVLMIYFWICMLSLYTECIDRGT